MLTLIVIVRIAGCIGFLLIAAVIGWRYGYSIGKKAGYRLGHRQGWCDSIGPSTTLEECESFTYDEPR